MAAKEMNNSVDVPKTDTENVKTVDYGGALLSRLREFYQSGLLCDFTLKVEHETFRVHKVILAGSCDYFHALFSHDMVESNKNEMEMKGLSAQGFRPLIDYAYTGELQLDMGNIETLLSVACFLQMTSAIQLCSEYLKSNLTFENADQLTKMAESFGLMDVSDYKRKHILTNFLTYAETDLFLNLDHETLADYLQDDGLKTTTETTLLKCVLKWYEHDKEKRKKYAHNVFDRIRYTIDGWPAIECAQKIELFKEDEKCQKILEDAEFYLQNPSRKHLYQSYQTRVRYPHKTLVQIGGSQKPLVYGFADGDKSENIGYGSNHFYHLSQKRWCPLGVVGTFDPRSHCAFIEVNDLGVLIGGYLYPAEPPDYLSVKRATKEVKLLVTGGFGLWDMPYMDTERAHHTAVRISGFIYVVGGCNSSGPLTTVEKLDMDKEEWSYARSLPDSLYDHASCAYQEKMYVSGGVVGDETVVKTLLCYDPKADTWTKKENMLAARAGHTMTTFHSKLIVCGGHPDAENTRCLSSVESYCPETNQWSHLQPMRRDCSYMGAVVLNDKLLICGGENSVKDLLDTIQEFDPKTNKWGHFGNLRTAIKSFGLCAVTVKQTDSEKEDSFCDEYGNMGLGSDDEDYPYFDEDGEYYSDYDYDYDDDDDDDYDLGFPAGYIPGSMPYMFEPTIDDEQE